MEFLEELQMYVDKTDITEQSVFKPVYVEDDEYENPASFVVEDDETGDTIATVSLTDETGEVIDGVNDDYDPATVTVNVESDGSDETKNLVLTKLKGMGFVNVLCDGEETDMSNIADLSSLVDDEEDYDDAKASVMDIEDDEISIADLEVDEN